MSSLDEHRANAPWYVAALTSAVAILREVLTPQPEPCAVRAIEDLERIMHIAQGFSG